MAGIKKISPKQKEFAKKFIETKNATEAANQIYNVKNRNMAAVIGCLNLQNPKIIKEIDRILEEGNIKDETLMERLKDGLDATLSNSFEGQTTNTDVPDFYARHKYLDTALKLKDYYPAQRTETKTLNIDIELENMPKEEYAKLLQSALNGLNTKTQEDDNL